MFEHTDLKLNILDEREEKIDEKLKFSSMSIFYFAKYERIS